MTISYLLAHYLVKQTDKHYMMYSQYLVKLKVFIFNKINIGLLLTMKENKVHYWLSNTCMDKHICMAVEFLFKFDSNKKSIIHIWVKNMLNKILILLLIQYLIFIILLSIVKLELNTILTIKLENLNMKSHPLEPKF